MKKTNLVVLKTTELLFWGDDRFDLNKPYRCLTPTETETDSYLINSYWFTQEEFDMYFEFAYDRIIREWTALGFVKDDKPISFKAFKEYVNMHTYGKQINNLRIGYVGAKGNFLYNFYPIHFQNKALQLKELYERHYKETLKGNMDYVDANKIKFNDRGYLISYSR